LGRRPFQQTQAWQTRQQPTGQQMCRSYSLPVLLCWRCTTPHLIVAESVSHGKRFRAERFRAGRG
jgi:hypothetical protein